MAIKPCKKCGVYIHTTSKFCPNCGEKNPFSNTPHIEGQISNNTKTKPNKKGNIIQKAIGALLGVVISIGLVAGIYFGISFIFDSIFGTEESTIEAVPAIDDDEVIEVEVPDFTEETQDYEVEVEPAEPKSTYQTQPVYQPQYETRDEWVQCWVCHGSGECDGCHGKGYGITVNPRGGAEQWRCPSCNGSGRCYTCGGTGGHYEKRTVQVR